MDHEEERRRSEIRSEREAKEREAELVSRLSKVEEEGERLGQEVVRLAAASRQEVTVRQKENKMVGEQLMCLLETLDGISLDQDMFELRARRKKVAARINSLMDTNDSGPSMLVNRVQDSSFHPLRRTESSASVMCFDEASNSSLASCPPSLPTSFISTSLPTTLSIAPPSISSQQCQEMAINFARW